MRHGFFLNFSETYIYIYTYDLDSHEVPLNVELWDTLYRYYFKANLELSVIDLNNDLDT